MIELKGSLKERVDTPAEISGHILLENKKIKLYRTLLFRFIIF